jgi:hypothetical protein
MNILNVSHCIFDPFDPIKSVFVQLPLLLSFINRRVFIFRDHMNSIYGNNPGGRDCRSLGNQCHVEGLNTESGFSVPCTLINEKTVFISNFIDTDFYNGCQVTLYNLSGGIGQTTVSAITNSVSTDGTNTYITFFRPLTNHTSGIISLNTDFQSHSEGQNTTASAQNSHAGGNGAIADLPGKFARGDTFFNQPGDGQYSFTAVSGVTEDDTPTVLMVSNKNLKIRLNMGYMFVMMIGARNIDGSQHALFMRYGIIHNEDGTVSLDGSIATLGSDLNSPSWGLGITADTINNALAITVTGANDTTIHWKARVDCIEIG